MAGGRGREARGGRARGLLAAALLLAGAAGGLVAGPAEEGAMSPGPTAGDQADPYAAARGRLLAEINEEVVATSHWLGTDRLAPAVLRALASVPREAFVPPALRDLAYRNHPLPIGDGQTISQPYIVAIMSHLLGVGPGDRVYELGTGSGYQAAVLGAMGVTVYSVEIVPALAERAAATLRSLGVKNVHVRAGDGTQGWPEAAPFDGVIVTAAGPGVPPLLVAQLRVGGRLVMPVGGADEVQQLLVLTKQPDGSLARRQVLPVRFVPITGPGGR